MHINSALAIIIYLRPYLLRSFLAEASVCVTGCGIEGREGRREGEREGRRVHFTHTTHTHTHTALNTVNVVF